MKSCLDCSIIERRSVVGFLFWSQCVKFSRNYLRMLTHHLEHCVKERKGWKGCKVAEKCHWWTLFGRPTSFRTGGGVEWVSGAVLRGLKDDCQLDIGFGSTKASGVTKSVQSSYKQRKADEKHFCAESSLSIILPQRLLKRFGNWNLSFFLTQHTFRITECATTA